MNSFLVYTVIGIYTGAAYAIAAGGLVLTYSTTRVFNIAHGAIGMFFTFLYWDFSQRQGIPVWLSLVLVLGVIAPLTGVVIQRFVTRGLGTAPVGVSLVVTVGILVGMIGIAQYIWKPAGRSIPAFFPEKFFHLGAVNISPQQIITVVVSILVAAGLYILLARTRVGTAMRASVDNAELLSLYGGRSDVVAALSWAIGTSLAALGGILLAPTLGTLQYYDLTLLVISAYAAAMLGKLTSLPMTYVGAMGLGLGQSYVVGYLQDIPFHEQLGGLPAVVPNVFLFIIVLAIPQAPLRIGQVKGIVSAPVPRLPKAGIWGVGMIAVVFILANQLADSSLLNLGAALAFGILMLSLVLLTGYGGFVSLAQFAFAGVGCVVYCQLDQPNLYGILVSMLAAGAVGGIVALFVLRLTGLYLALATLAFGQMMDKLFFTSGAAFEFNNPLPARRLGILGYRFDQLDNYVVMMAAVFVVVAIALVTVRRGRLGRILIAMRDSQAACGTLGLDMRWFRVGVFAASASIAGLSGALLAGMRLTITAGDFQYFNSLILLLIAGVWGVTSVTGALIGGYFMMYLPVAQADNPSVAGLMFVGLAVGAIILGRNPNGLSNIMFMIPRWIQGTLYPVLAERYPGMALRVREYGFGARDDDDPDPDGGDPDQAVGAENEEVDSDAVAAR